MVTMQELREWSNDFESVTEEPHFEKISFRVKSKIFLTVDENARQACLMLSPVDQSVFCTASEYIYPVPNSWGKKGATYADLKKVSKKLFKDALRCAYCKTAPAKLAALYSSK